jgi:hypothetical protein
VRIGACEDSLADGSVESWHIALLASCAEEQILAIGTVSIEGGGAIEVAGV